MLTEQLQLTFGQILSSPLTYQQALKDLWSWFGRPHLVVQAYIKDLRTIPVLKDNDVDALSTFQQRLHGAICSLQAAGYRADLVEKLPYKMASQWDQHVHKQFLKHENVNSSGASFTFLKPF